MTALQLLRQAIGLLTDNPLKTLVVVGPAAALMVAVCVVTALSAPELLSIGATNVVPANLPLGWMSAVLLGVFVFSYALMAILWHRYTLGDTHVSQPMSTPLVLGYLWRVLMLALIQLAISLAFIIPLILSSQNGNGAVQSPALPSILLTTFISQLLLVWASLRLSLILPAAAIGRPIRMLHSWRYTRNLARPLWGVAAVLALLNTTITALVTSAGLKSPAFVLAFELPIYILEGLLIFSILTTVYARQVQQNPPSPL
jgi:hypothetical protein